MSLSHIWQWKVILLGLYTFSWVEQIVWYSARWRVLLLANQGARIGSGDLVTGNVYSLLGEAPELASIQQEISTEQTYMKGI